MGHFSKGCLQRANLTPNLRNHRFSMKMKLGSSVNPSREVGSALRIQWTQRVAFGGCDACFTELSICRCMPELSVREISERRLGTSATKQASADIMAFGRTEFVHFDSESCFFPLL